MPTGSQILTRRGIINVPLFKPAFTPVSSDFSTNIFRANVLYPQISGGYFLHGLFAGGLGITTWRMGIPKIAGLSVVDANPGGGGGQIQAVYNVSPSGGYGLGILVFDGSTNGWVYNPQPNNPGTWGINNFSGNADTTFSGNPGIGPGSPSYGMPFWDNFGNGPYMGYMTDNTPFGAAQLTAHLADPAFPGGKQINCMTLPYLFTGGLSTINYQQVPDPGVNIVWGLLDAPAGGPIPRQVAAYQPQAFGGIPNGPIINNTVRFDDSVLQSVWDNTLVGNSGYRNDVFKGGWIIILGTNNAGPTGQTYEVAVCSPDLTQYNLINFVAQDPAAVPALHRTGPGFGWQVKIDPDGILWFNSGNGADNGLLWFSYSPPLWPFPQFTFTPGAFRLPCYTTCYPVSPEFSGA